MLGAGIKRFDGDFARGLPGPSASFGLFPFGNEASRERSASTDAKISPRRQTSGVVIWLCALGIGCWAVSHAA